MLILEERQIKISNIEVGVVATRPGQMYAWPGIVRINENEILVAASERRYHVCPYGREVVIRSEDNGKSWELPREVYNSQLDDRDANLCITPDGTLILSWFTSTAFDKFWSNEAERVTDKMRTELLGTWLCHSTDGGENWGKALRMPAGVHIAPSVLSDSSLICIGSPSQSEEALNVYKSNDMGLSWRKVYQFECKKIWVEEAERYMLEFDENHVFELSPGKLTVMFRTEPAGDGYLYQAFSDDNGETWSKPSNTGIWGFPPQLMRLSDGTIMCSYSHRKTPYSIRVVFSHDNGRSWDIDNIATLYEWKDKPDMGYPSSIELSPNKILTVFYCSRCDADGKSPTSWNKNISADSSPEGILSITFTLEKY